MSNRKSNFYIGNQEHHQFDTVFCISLSGNIYSGFLYRIGNASYMQIFNKNIVYEFRYHTINPYRLVLLEKFFNDEKKIWNHEYEKSVTNDEYEFLKNKKQQYGN